jgi:hypothetical protein
MLDMYACADRGYATNWRQMAAAICRRRMPRTPIPQLEVSAPVESVSLSHVSNFRVLCLCVLNNWEIKLDVRKLFLQQHCSQKELFYKLTGEKRRRQPTPPHKVESWPLKDVTFIYEGPSNDVGKVVTVGGHARVLFIFID